MNSTFTICSWNILTTYPGNATRTLHQDDRLKSIVDNINTTKPDIAGLYEVLSDNTSQLESDLGYSHNTDTPYSQDHHGMSLLLSSHEEQHNAHIAHFTDDNRKALVSDIDGVRVIASHLSYSPLKPQWREAQVRQLIQEAADSPKAVIMADFNCMSWQKARKLLLRAGYTSVTGSMNPSYPKTFPAPGYLKALKPYQWPMSFLGLSIDDIYVKGLGIVDSGILTGESDHLGLWATLKS